MSVPTTKTSRGPGAAEHGQAHGELAALLTKAAKNPDATTVLVVEMDRRCRYMVDVTGEEVQEQKRRPDRFFRPDRLGPHCPIPTCKFAVCNISPKGP